MNFILEHLGQFESISKVIGSITAILGFLYGGYKFIIKPVALIVQKTDIIYKEVTPNGGGSIKDYIKSIKDKTEKIEEKLILLSNLEKTFREDAPTAIFECRKDGFNTYVNRTYCKWMGASREDLLGFGWRNYLSSFSVRTDYDDEWKEAFNEGREVKFTITFKNKRSGKRFYCDVHAYPIKGISGEVEQYLGVMSKEDSKEKLVNDG